MPERRDATEGGRAHAARRCDGRDESAELFLPTPAPRIERRAAIFKNSKREHLRGHTGHLCERRVAQFTKESDFTIRFG